MHRLIEIVIGGYLHAADVGAKTSVSCPPRINGPEAAAMTVAKRSVSSSAVSCGFCPAALSRSCTIQKENGYHTSRMEADIKKVYVHIYTCEVEMMQNKCKQP